MKKEKNENIKILLKAMIDKDIYRLQDLADTLEISLQTLYRYMNGKSGIKLEMLNKIEEVLGIKFNKENMVMDIYGKFYFTK